MNYRHLFIYFLTLFPIAPGLYSCKSTKKEASAYVLTQDPPFSILEAYSQPWTAGIPEGGSGIQLHITFETFTEDVVIQTFFFRNKKTNAQLSPQNRNKYVGYFTTMVRGDVIMDSDPLEEAKNSPPKAFPFDLKDDEAVIGYLRQGEVKYTLISEIEQKPMLAYPQSNTKNTP
ncbi:hypothetical protein [Altibacter sp.]|uniref:hypothetical protein n=1 Tax=Altibacter sp. TaxID=2024823 RepID=UPI00258ED652|nr:hypothetical protein [Altibacter sp.]MCW8981839.1 hypothetical protein [Altibacter sp.]MCW9036883.1 hypothetical protein [Altibacter sp.]